MGTIGHRLGTARLVLFDIDGTLLRTGNRVHGRSIVQACQEITGHDITKHFGSVDAGGRTDRYIVSELLRRCGFSQDAIDSMFDAIASRSIELTGAGLAQPDPGWVLAGSSELIRALTDCGAAVGLVTGNLPRIAELKLACAGLWNAFAAQVPLIAGFGDLSEDRNDLTRSALAQAQTAISAHLSGDDVVIVGDTPRDIDCARAIGATCVAVATGRYSVDDLRSYADVAGGTHVVATLEDVDLCALFG
jgi:phosphoglycolate phosphatase